MPYHATPISRKTQYVNIYIYCIFLCICHGSDLVTIGEIMSGSRIDQSVEHSPCKRCVPGSSPGLTAHFSHPVTFGAQCGAVHACLVCLRRLAMKIYLRNSRTNFKFVGVYVMVRTSSPLGR